MRAALTFAAVLACACGADDERIPTDAAMVDGSPVLDAAGDAPAVGDRCGGITGITCAPDHFCDYPNDSCGAGDLQGTCRERPTACPELLVAEPTCGCDGVVYDQPCEAHAAGTDLAAAGGCPVPEGSFACGYTQCTLADRYCERQVSDVADEGDTFACRPLPGCPTTMPTSACLLGEPCGDMCSGVAATGRTLTCPGG